jgi:predicted ATP-dependent protease
LGQINALSVIHYADVEFGLPSRLTASVYQGGGDLLAHNFVQMQAQQRNVKSVHGQSELSRS